MGIEEELTKYNKKQIDFIFGMIKTGNILKSCEIANISEATAYKYLKNGIQDDINKIRKRLIEKSLVNLEYTTVKATEVINDILVDESTPKSVKLNACKTVLDYSLKIREQTEIIERLDNIEKRVKENG